jgi:flagellar capping protein FliD
MSTDTESLGERVANIEGTVEQMDKRVDDLGGRMDERFNTLEGRMDRLDTKVDEAKRDIRNWLVLGILTLSAVIAVFALFV